MSSNTILWTIFFSVLPISELRGAIPYAVHNGMPNLVAFFIAVGANALVGPLVFIFLSTLHKWFIKWTWYQNLFEKFVEKTRKKIHDKVEKYGYLGITLFVAIPLPITGAYIGALGAWILGLSKIKTFLACILGVIISGTIVSLIVFYGPEVFKGLYGLFVKQVH